MYIQEMKISLPLEEGLKKLKLFRKKDQKRQLVIKTVIKKEK